MSGVVHDTTREQRRAAHALQAVKRVAASPTLARDRYRSYAERIGPAILTNGLGQALATELAGAERNLAHRELYDNLQQWLCGEHGLLRGPKLLEALVAVDQTTYLRVQVEALAWLVWHKKLCRALLPREPVVEAPL